jgi:hypothetical protein
MVRGGPRDREPVGEDLEVIDLLADEGTTPRRPEREDDDNDWAPRRRGLFLLGIAGAVVALAGVSVVVSLNHGDKEADPRRGTSNPSRTVPAVVPGSTVIPPDTVPSSTSIPPEERPPETTPGDASTTAPLLPEGAPSTPHTGELVASVANEESFPGGGYYLYADGRLIWSSGQADVWGGMVEQRLTPAGVARVRSKFLAQLAPNSPLGTDDDCWTGVPPCVRGDDGRLLRILPGPGSPATARLVSYLRTLDSSLPRTEWATSRIRTYVASRFDVCLGTYANLPDRAIPVQIDLSTVLAALPTAAAELFGDREYGDGGKGPCSHFFETTLDAARALADVFLSPTGGGTHQYSGIVIRNAELATIQSDVSKGIIAYVSFQPLLPNGTPRVAYVG